MREYIKAALQPASFRATLTLICLFTLLTQDCGENLQLSETLLQDSLSLPSSYTHSFVQEAWTQKDKRVGI